MKFKNLFAITCVLSLLVFGNTSCSSSDHDYDFTKVSKTYDKENLKINGVEVEKNLEQSIDVQLIDGGQGTLVLNNIVVGEPKLSFNVIAEDKNGGVVINEIKDSNSDRTIIISAKILDESKMELTYDVKYTAPVVGKWDLKISEKDGKRIGDILFEVDFNDGDLNDLGGLMNQYVPSLVGGLLGDAIDKVTVEFKENGYLVVDYKMPKGQVASIEPSVLPPFYYFIKNGELNVAVDEFLVDDLLKGIIEGLNTPESGLDVKFDDIKALFNKTGKHYSLPLNFTEKDEYCEFFVDQTLISKLVPIAKGLIPENLEEIEVMPGVILEKEQIDLLLDGFVNAKSIKLGLGFNKAK